MSPKTQNKIIHLLMKEYFPKMKKKEHLSLLKSISSFPFGNIYEHWIPQLVKIGEKSKGDPDYAMALVEEEIQTFYKDMQGQETEHGVIS